MRICTHCGRDADAPGGCCFENWSDRVDENWRVPLAMGVIGLVILFVLLRWILP